MTINTKNQYLEKVRELTSQKRRRAFQLKQAKEETITKQIIEEEKRFWADSKDQLESGFFIPFEYLCEIMGCGEFERHCILMALGYELEPDAQKDFASLQDSNSLDYLTPYLMQITWHKPLKLWELCETFREDSILMRVFFQPTDQKNPFIKQRLELRRRILCFFLWDLSEDESLRPFLTRWDVKEELAPLIRQQIDLAPILGDGNYLVELYGEEGSGRRFCVKTCCTRRGQMAYFIHLEEVLQYPNRLEELSDKILLECVIFQAVPVFIIPDEFIREGIPDFIKDLAESLLPASGLLFLISHMRIPDRQFCKEADRLIFEIPDMSLGEKRAVWRREGEAYSFADNVHIEEMANLFDFTYGKIKEALKSAFYEAKSRKKTEIDKESLIRGCYSLFEQNMVKKAVKIPSVYVWGDLVLPAFQKEIILTACNQIKYKHKVYEDWGFQNKTPYGRGVSLIFAGPPGTGKTMAAQIFAAELGIDLYKIELSTVVSKYVGETEKNLNEIFDQASKGQIVLFFDEADVLFAKRTEVKESNDKYSNMEAAFLLQKMESYDGVTILATNLIQNFDEAFKRRVKFIIDFPFPNAKQRKELWEKSIPLKAPVGELDIEYLAANFELSGSNIRNIILHAAFLAASYHKEISMKEILMAVKNEFAKSGKTLTKEEIGEYYMLLSDAR